MTAYVILVALIVSIAGVAMSSLPATAAGPGDRVLVFGSSDNGFEGDNAAATLRTFGLQVDRLGALPADLTPYTSVWYVEAYKGLTTDEEGQLADFASRGGGLYLTGERPCCEALNGSVQRILRSTLVDQDVRVGGLGDIGGPFTFNPGVTDHVASFPNLLVDFVPHSPGGLDGLGGVSSGNVLASSSSVPVAAVWPEKDMLSGRGRIAVLMDIDWLGDPARVPIAENLANFLQHGSLCGDGAGFTWTGAASCSSVLAPGTLRWTVSEAAGAPTVDIQQRDVTQTCTVTSTGTTTTVECVVSSVQGSEGAVWVTAASGGRSSSRFVHVVMKNDPRNVPVPFALTSDWWSWPDADQDGLPDLWETQGVYVDGHFVDLPGQGADPRHKDLFLRMDYEEGEAPGAITQGLLVNHFAKAPLKNPDGVDGVSLHLRSGTPVPSSVVGDFTLTRDNLVRVGTYAGLTTDPMMGGVGVPTLSKWLFNQRGRVSNRSYDCGGSSSSGCAFIKGSVGWTAVDVGGFVAALEINVPTWDAGARQDALEFVLAVISAHELGHELGLNHHGAQAEPTGDKSYKSVMSYAYSHFGLPSGGILSLPHIDYSRTDKVNLDWKLGKDIGALTFVPGQWGENPDFYVNSAGDAPWVDGSTPVEPTLDEALRSADADALAEFVAASGIPAGYQAPTLHPASADVRACASVDIPLDGGDPQAGPVTYVVDEQSPSGTAVPVAGGVRFTANPDASGVTQFLVHAVGSRFSSPSVSVTVTVTPTSSGPEVRLVRSTDAPVRRTLAVRGVTAAPGDVVVATVSTTGGRRVNGVRGLPGWHRVGRVLKGDTDVEVWSTVAATPFSGTVSARLDHDASFAGMSVAVMTGADGAVTILRSGAGRGTPPVLATTSARGGVVWSAGVVRQRQYPGQPVADRVLVHKGGRGASTGWLERSSGPVPPAVTLTAGLTATTAARWAGLVFEVAPAR